jgi:hypothetical protein
VFAGVVLALSAGCASGPPLEAVPVLESPAPVLVELEDNPLYVPLGPTPESYRKVFESVLSVLSDYGFEILEANAYDGRVETLPRVAPGLLQPWKPGSPALRDRLLYTLQTYRNRAQVSVQPAPNGGYFIYVVVFRELEDLPRPTRSTAGAAIFRTDSDVERQYEVVDPTVFESNWIPKGRDVEVEQGLLARLKQCLL